MPCTQERFLKDASAHIMTIEKDDGLFRHLTFKAKGSSAYHFNISTWPGYLCISGDMGCFVFSRLPDMFDFFRGKDINLGYWAEKAQALNRHGGCETFSNSKFKAAVESAFARWEFDSDKDKAKAWTCITQDSDGPLSYDHSNEHEAFTSAYKWECPITELNRPGIVGDLKL